jgi:hypothetical protein
MQKAECMPKFMKYLMPVTTFSAPAIDKKPAGMTTKKLAVIGG